MNTKTTINLKTKLYENIINLKARCTSTPTSSVRTTYLLLCSLLCKSMRIEYYNILLSSTTGNNIDTYSFSKESTIKAIIDRLFKDGSLKIGSSGPYRLYSLTGKGKKNLKNSLTKFFPHGTLTETEIDNLYQSIDKVPPGQHGAMCMAILCKLLMLCHDPAYMIPFMQETEAGTSNLDGASVLAPHDNKNLFNDLGFEFGFPPTPVYFEADRFTDPVLRKEGSVSRSLVGNLSQYMDLNDNHLARGRKDSVIIFVGNRTITASESKRLAEAHKRQNPKAKIISSINPTPAETYEAIAMLLALSIIARRKKNNPELYPDGCDLSNEINSISLEALLRAAGIYRHSPLTCNVGGEGLSGFMDILFRLQEHYGNNNDICLKNLKQYILNIRKEVMNTHETTALSILRDECDNRLKQLYENTGGSIYFNKDSNRSSSHSCCNGVSISYIPYYETEERLKCLLPEGFFRDGVRGFLHRLLGDSYRKPEAYTSGRLVLKDRQGDPVLYLRNCYLVGDTIVSIEDMRSDICSHERFKRFLSFYGFDKKIIYVGIVSDDHSTFMGKLSDGYLYKDLMGNEIPYSLYKAFRQELFDTYRSYIKNDLLLPYNNALDFCFVTLSDYLGSSEADLSPFIELGKQVIIKREMGAVLNISEPQMTCRVADELRFAPITDNDFNYSRQLSW